jgi:glutamate-1-semialdehyde 2,1-aminomutase
MIVDEVMTGFRVSSGGACGLYGIRPDLVTFGKVIGAGLPVGAFGGRADVMDQVAPAGPIYQAGTLSGNPMAMAAGFRTLALMTPAAYEKLERTSAALAEGLARAAAEAKVPAQVNRVGSMLTVFFSDRPVFDAASARACSTRRFAAWYHALLDGGVYFPPSQFEAAFLSTAHTQDDVDATLRAAKGAFAAAAKVA